MWISLNVKRVKALPPMSGDFATIVCPAFDADADFEYDGDLYERTEEAAFNVPMEIYYFEEDDTVYDYVLDSDSIDAEMIRSLADYLYTESVLANLEGTYNMYVFAKSDYDAKLSAFNTSQRERAQRISELESEIARLRNELGGA